MIRLVILTLICSTSCFLYADKKQFSKSDLDRIIDERVLLYIHRDIAQGAIEALKKEGVTDYEIVESMAKCLRRDMNCPKEEVGCARADSAMWWIAELGDQNQMSNLLYVAQTATYHLSVGPAIRAYYGGVKDKERFLKDVLPLLDRTDDHRSAIWRCLMEEAKGPMRERILSIATEKVDKGDVNVYYADLVLAKWKPGYADSAKRREVIRSLLDDPVHGKEITPEGRKRLLERLSKGNLK